MLFISAQVKFTLFYLSSPQSPEEACAPLVSFSFRIPDFSTPFDPFPDALERVHASPCLLQETDGRGEGSGASAGQSPHHAAAAVRPAEVPRRISGVGSTVRPQLFPVRPAEPPALGRGQGIGARDAI